MEYTYVHIISRFIFISPTFYIYIYVHILIAIIEISMTYDTRSLEIIHITYNVCVFTFTQI